MPETICFRSIGLQYSCNTQIENNRAPFKFLSTDYLTKFTYQDQQLDQDATRGKSLSFQMNLLVSLQQAIRKPIHRVGLCRPRENE